MATNINDEKDVVEDIGEEEEEIEDTDNEDIDDSEADEEEEEEDDDVMNGGAGADDEEDIEESEADEEEESGAEEEEPEESGEEEEEASAAVKKTKKTNKKSVAVGSIADLKTKAKAKKSDIPTVYDIDNDDDEEEEEKENYLQKFDHSLRNNFILNHHPEANTHNYEEVKALTRVVRDGRGIIIDPLHKTIPILTKYEMTRVIGQRAKQLDSGAKPFVKVPLNVIDGYHIAVLELEQKKLPFIIKRPYPNGGVEYWCVSDLEVL
jgi:DNA-directed RNA polymerase subunit K/omega